MSYRLVSICILSLLLFSCDKENTITDKRILEKFEGIAQTDLKGNLIQDDVSDWQPRTCQDSGSVPFRSPKNYCFKPSYPNPTDRFTFIEYDLPRRSTAKIEIYSDAATKIATLIYNDTLPSGSFRYYFDFGDTTRKHLPGIYRCYLEMKDLDSNKIYKSFGDIQLLPLK